MEELLFGKTMDVASQCYINKVMTQEEKQLLLKDLSARLPYGVIIQYKDFKPVKMYSINELTFNGTYSLELAKPYLRPMSSMTEEEKEYLKREFGIVDIDGEVVDFGEFPSKSVSMSLHKLSSFYKWLDSHYLDYHGLIEKGLALPAPEGMYPYQSPKQELTEDEKTLVSIVSERIHKQGPTLKLKGKEKADFENEFNRFKQIGGLINWPARAEIYKEIILWFIAWSRDHITSKN